MLAFLLGGLLLSAVQQDAHGFPVSNSYFRPGDVRAMSSLSAISDDGMPSLEWYNPWLLLGSGYRPYRSPHFYSPFNNELYWPAPSDAVETPTESRDATGNNQASTDRLLTQDDNRNAIDKRDSYLSMCHFKICNLGRKRRIAQTLSSPAGSSVGLRR